jgi:glycosyltransferase involved in cell wall biosynthesis
MKRVTIISTNEFDAFAGSEMLWAEMAARMAAQGTALEILRPAWTQMPERISRLNTLDGIRVSTLPTSISIHHRIANRLGIRRAADHFARLRRRFLEQARPNLVLISQGGLTDGCAWMEACAEQGIPFVAIVHLVADALWPSPNEIELASVIYPQAKAVFFISVHNRALATRQLGIDFSSAPLVRNPFNVDYHTDFSWPELTGEWKLACVGRLGAEHKGQDLLIEVLANPKWRERPLTVTLFGQGHHRSLLERLITQFGTANVKFGGYTDGIMEVWHTHHALVMPSRYEGLPIALVEAMLCHRMAIVTDVGGNVELLEEGITGFIAAAPTISELDAAMERAWQRRLEWKEAGLRAGESVRKAIPKDPVLDFINVLSATGF